MRPSSVVLASLFVFSLGMPARAQTALPLAAPIRTPMVEPPDELAPDQLFTERERLAIHLAYRLLVRSMCHLPVTKADEFETEIANSYGLFSEVFARYNVMHNMIVSYHKTPEELCADEK